MIKIEILETKDSLRKGTYAFHKDYLVLGSNIFSDIYLPTENIPESFLALEIENNELFISFHVDWEYIHVNNKKSTGKKKLRSNDLISFSHTKLKIIHFEHSNIETKKQLLLRRLDELKQENSPILDIIERLNNQL